MILRQKTTGFRMIFLPDNLGVSLIMLERSIPKKYMILPHVIRK